MTCNASLHTLPPREPLEDTFQVLDISTWKFPGLEWCVASVSSKLASSLCVAIQNMMLSVPEFFAPPLVRLWPKLDGSFTTMEDVPPSVQSVHYVSGGDGTESLVPSERWLSLLRCCVAGAAWLWCSQTFGLGAVPSWLSVCTLGCDGSSR